MTDYEGAKACDLDAYAAWCRGLLARGVYAPASQFEAWFPSLAHTPEHVARTVAAATAAFAEIARMSATDRRACATPSATSRHAAGVVARRRPPPTSDRRELALLAAGGPRVAAHREDVELAVAAVDEGYRLHYGAARARCRSTIPTSRCSPATACTRSASRGWRRSAT